jgi:hypothetical protein
MKRRYRTAAVLTLMAMVFSLAGMTFGSACAMAKPAAVTDMHAQHDGTSSAPHQDSEQSLPSCPSGLAAGCATAPSLAADGSITLVAASELVITAPAAHDVVDHLRSNIIFHPPRF